MTDKAIATEQTQNDKRQSQQETGKHGSTEYILESSQWLVPSGSLVVMLCASMLDGHDAIRYRLIGD